MNCPNVLAHGTCSDAACTFVHNVLTCDYCNYVFATEDAYAIHLTTDKHKRHVLGTSFIEHCTICAANVNGGEAGWKLHLDGRRHHSNALAKAVSPNIEPQGPTATASAEFCDLCQCLVQKSHWTSHINGEKHKSRQMFTRYRNAVEESETDKNGISIAGHFDFDLIESAAAAAGVRNMATITTSLPNSNCVLQDFRLASSQGRRTITPA